MALEEGLATLWVHRDSLDISEKKSSDGSSFERDVGYRADL